MTYEELKKMKLLSDYAKEVYQFRSIPHKLSEISLQLSGRYAFLSEEMKYVKIARAQFFLDQKTVEGKAKSDTFVEALWRATIDGHIDVWIKQDMTAIEELNRAIRSSLIIANNEAKNEY